MDKSSDSVQVRRESDDRVFNLQTSTLTKADQEFIAAWKPTKEPLKPLRVPTRKYYLKPRSFSGGPAIHQVTTARRVCTPAGKTTVVIRPPSCGGGGPPACGGGPKR